MTEKTLLSFLRLFGFLRLDYALRIFSKLPGYQYTNLSQTVYGQTKHYTGTLSSDKSRDALALQMGFDNIGGQFTLNCSNRYKI